MTKCRLNLCNLILFIADDYVQYFVGFGKVGKTRKVKTEMLTDKRMDAKQMVIRNDNTSRSFKLNSFDLSRSTIHVVKPI